MPSAPASPSLQSSFRTAALLAALACITGCAANFSETTPAASTGMALAGHLHGGQSPITNAQIYLYAASTGGYGNSARSILGGTGYVTTGAGGAFSITGDYTCQAGDQVYLLATGGNPGLTPSTVNNSAITMLAALGACGTLTSATNIVIDEVTTVAAVYALAPYMTSLTYVGSSNTTLGTRGIANAFLSAANLASIPNGTANTTTPGGNGIVPQAEIDTLANAMATCVNSDGTGSPCASFFAATTPSGGGPVPTNTAFAILNVALNPGYNVAALYNLVQANGPFQPTLSAAPHDWTLAVTYSGGGLNGADPIAIDGAGDVWVVDGGSTTLSLFDPAGNALSPAGGYASGIAAGDFISALAVDSSNNAWIGVVYVGNTPATTKPRLQKYNTAGTMLSPTGGYTGGGVGPNYVDALAFDATGNLWSVGTNVSNSTQTAEVSKFTSAGAAISPTAGYPIPAGTAIGYGPSLFADAAGDIWAGTTEVSSAGAVLIQGSPCGATQGQTSAIDRSGNIWAATSGAALTECNSSGTRISPTAGYPTNFGYDTPEAVQVDGTGRIWYLANDSNTDIGVMDASGNVYSPAGGYQNPQITNNGSTCLAIDGSGSLWVAAGSHLVQYVGLASPVVTPLATAVATNTLGQRP